MSKSGVNQCMARLDVAYPNHFKRNDLDADFSLQVYHEILDDIDDDLLMAATKQWLSTARPFHPSPGELRDMALQLITRDEPSADEAWTEVLRQMRNPGYYGIPQWSTERVAKTMEAFGRWKDFCLIESDQMGIIRAQFMKIYEAQLNRERADQLMLPETREIVTQYQIAQLTDAKRSIPQRTGNER